ncbi:hypothetical protein BB561_002882 [Smittium simulii]|uniref:Uncharacterized protein n=1 Tax=Smittium simulii TaxID=133385 RepID=A0A2T9YNV7_9FUNG|nr:hypothetical protein BB561_002882 [Smittium simulii]
MQHSTLPLANTFVPNQDYFSKYSTEKLSSLAQFHETYPNVSSNYSFKKPRPSILASHSTSLRKSGTNSSSSAEAYSLSEKFDEDFVLLDVLSKKTLTTCSQKPTMFDQNILQSATPAFNPNDTYMPSLNRRKSSVLEELAKQQPFMSISKNMDSFSKSYESIPSKKIIKTAANKPKLNLIKHSLFKLGQALRLHKNKSTSKPSTLILKNNTSLELTRSKTYKINDHISNYPQPNTIGIGQRDYNPIADLSDSQEISHDHYHNNNNNKLQISQIPSESTSTKSTEYSLNSNNELIDKIEMISEYNRIITRLETNKSLLESRIAVQKAHFQLFMSSINNKYDLISTQNDTLKKKLIQVRRSNKMMIDDLINLIESKEDEIFKLELKLDTL